MSYLGKEESLFLRDNEGKLVGVDVELESLEGKPKIKVVPLTRSEIFQLSAEAKEKGATAEQDEKLILKHCLEPKYTEEEIKFLKPDISSAIVTLIMAVSLNMSQDKVKALADITDADELKKN